MFWGLYFHFFSNFELNYQNQIYRSYLFDIDEFSLLRRNRWKCTCFSYHIYISTTWASFLLTPLLIHILFSFLFHIILLILILYIWETETERSLHRIFLLQSHLSLSSQFISHSLFPPTTSASSSLGRFMSASGRFSLFSSLSSLTIFALFIKHIHSFTCQHNSVQFCVFPSFYICSMMIPWFCRGYNNPLYLLGVPRDITAKCIDNNKQWLSYNKWLIPLFKSM